MCCYSENQKGIIAAARNHLIGAMGEVFEVFSTMELLEMGYISESDMQELMEPMGDVAEMAA